MPKKGDTTEWHLKLFLMMNRRPFQIVLRMENLSYFEMVFVLEIFEYFSVMFVEWSALKAGGMALYKLRHLF